MRVFVAGASGYIGFAVARAFREHGHEVWGLTRSQTKARILSQHEIEPIVGNIKESSSFQKALDHCEVYVNCAFEYTKEGIATDLALLTSFLETASKTSRPRAILYTSGIWVYSVPKVSLVDENTPLSPIKLIEWRPKHEQKLMEHNISQLRTVVIRPGHAYGESGGLVGLFFSQLEKGEIVQIGTGQNYWPMIHLYDLANAYVLAAEKECNKMAFNIIDDSYVTLGEVVRKIAELGGGEKNIKKVSMDEARRIFGDSVDGLSLSTKASNDRAKRILGWYPRQRGFLHDVLRFHNAWKMGQEHLTHA